MKAFAFKLALVLAPLVALGCKQGQHVDATEAKPAGSTAAAPAAPATPPSTTTSTGGAGQTTGVPSEPLVLRDLPTPRPEDLPGIPIQELPEPALKQLFAFAQDDFCYCGCPHTVQGCLKDHAPCRHAKRMIILAAAEAVSGAKSAEITKSLNDYYASFAADKRYTFDVLPGACLGPATAPITITEFSDFECPYCAMARPLLEKIVADNKGQVRLCFKPFPLSLHPHSGPAAEAAMYALEKGKFWEMHDLLFVNQQSLENDDLKKYAQQVGLDADDMLRAINAQKYAAQITASKDEGTKAKVQGTPSIYINGRPLTIPVGDALIQHAIEDELEWKQNGGKWGAD